MSNINECNLLVLPTCGRDRTIQLSYWIDQSAPSLFKLYG